MDKLYLIKNGIITKIWKANCMANIFECPSATTDILQHTISSKVINHISRSKYVQEHVQSKPC